MGAAKRAGSSFRTCSSRRTSQGRGLRRIEEEAFFIGLGSLGSRLFSIMKESVWDREREIVVGFRACQGYIKASAACAVFLHLKRDKRIEMNTAAFRRNTPSKQISTSFWREEVFNISPPCFGTIARPHLFPPLPAGPRCVRRPEEGEGRKEGE